MPGSLLSIERILNILSETPTRVATLTAGLETAQLRTPPAPGEWSANDVLAHLRVCSDVWGRSIALIISEDMPTIRAVSPRTWIKETDYLELDFRPSLRAFAAQRTELLALLEPLSPEYWSRAATVTGAVRPLVRTVHTYAERLAIHERSHIKQVERIMNTMRR
ncbi:MAG: DinB family protein [Bellilinea sp.]